ncbi:MAG TPA: AAA family ATPase [Acidiferrobacterales bacterium]
MYTEHYGLAQLPFTISPDTHFLYAHPSYLDALNTLVVAVRSGEGFIKVVGEVGTGKTLLCRKLLNVLEGEGYVTAYVPNPYLEPMTLLLAVADELGVAYEANCNQHQLLKLLTGFLIEAHREHKHVVLCLDEAQAMPVETLETLRLLSNLETEQSKLLQVVLFGQPELDVKLDDPAIRQLKQRIAFSCNLKPISNDDVERYVAFRLEVAGYHGPRLFAREAVRLLHRASRGVPRLINILAHKAMMAGYGEGARYITDRYVKLAIADTESTRARLKLRRARLLKLAGAAVAATMLSAGALVWGHWL